jgi:hypothetical protein
VELGRTHTQRQGRLTAAPGGCLRTRFQREQLSGPYIPNDKYQDPACRHRAATCPGKIRNQVDGANDSRAVRMERTVAAAMSRSQGGTEDHQKGPVMADRRLAAENAEEATRSLNDASEDLGDGLVADDPGNRERPPMRKEALSIGPGQGVAHNHWRETPAPRVRSRLFDVLLGVWTGLFGFAIPILMLLRARDHTIRIATRGWARGVLFGLKHVVGLDYVEHGREAFSDEPCLIVCNHQSTWETIAFLLLVPDVAIITKDELIRIPVFGWYLRQSPMIVIDRESLRTTASPTSSIGTRASTRSPTFLPTPCRS